MLFLIIMSHIFLFLYKPYKILLMSNIVNFTLFGSGLFDISINTLKLCSRIHLSNSLILSGLAFKLCYSTLKSTYSGLIFLWYWIKTIYQMPTELWDFSNLAGKTIHFSWPWAMRIIPSNIFWWFFIHLQADFTHIHLSILHWLFEKHPLHISGFLYLLSTLQSNTLPYAL